MAVTKKIKTIFQFRRATTEEWILNKDVTPAAGEPCYDLDLKTLRIGDGVTTYENLPIVGKAEIGDSGELQVEIDTLKSTVETLQTNVTSVVTNVSSLKEQVGDANIADMQNNITQVAGSVNNLTTQVSANNDEIVKVKQTLETKVDSEVVETAKVELKAYTDAEIAKIQSGNIDDGEI